MPNQTLTPAALAVLEADRRLEEVTATHRSAEADFQAALARQQASGTEDARLARARAFLAGQQVPTAPDLRDMQDRVETLRTAITLQQQALDATLQALAQEESATRLADFWSAVSDTIDAADQFLACLADVDTLRREVRARCRGREALPALEFPLALMHQFRARLDIYRQSAERIRAAQESRAAKVA
jgi:hypothetical protein